MKNFLLLLFSVLFLQACDTTKSITDGTPPTATPEQVAALYQQLSASDNVTLSKLIYYIDDPILIMNRENFTLDGNGSTFIMRNKAADVVRVEGSSNVVLKNFKATHVEPEGPLGCTGSVVQVYNSQNVTIESTELNGSGIIGVVAYNAANLAVSNNYIYNNSQYGVLYDKDCTVQITENRFEDNGASGNAHVGQALNAFLSEVEMMDGNQQRANLQMSGNRFQ